MRDHRERDDRAENADAELPIDATEAKHPTQPIDSTEPTLPIDRTEPFDPIERIEFSDQSDIRDGLLELITGTPGLSASSRELVDMRLIQSQMVVPAIPNA